MLMTKEELSEYRELQKEIKRLQKRVEKFKNVNYDRLSDTVTGSSIEFPYTQHSIKIEGFDSEKRNNNIKKLTNVLSGQIERSQNKTVEIAEFICSIESVKVRTIFEYRYYDLMTWQQIAFMIGCTSEAHPRNIHDEYFKRLRFTTKEI